MDNSIYNVKPGHVRVDVVTGGSNGFARPCLTVGNNNTATRVAGPKQYGGGNIVYSFVVDAEDLRSALNEYAPAQESCNG